MELEHREFTILREGNGGIHGSDPVPGGKLDRLGMYTTTRMTWAPKIRCRLCGRELVTVNGRHLNSAHPELPGPSRAEAYRRMFRLKYVMSPYARTRMSRGQRRRFVRLGRVWTRRRVIGELHARIRRGERVNLQAVHDDAGALMNGARKVFGSWEEALRAARIEPQSARRAHWWDREYVLRRIRDRVECELPLQPGKVDRVFPMLSRKARLLFGTWAAALEAAGVDPATAYTRRRWDRGKVIAAVRSRQAKRRPLRASVVQREDGALYNAARAHIGSWSAALRAAR